MVLSVFAFSGQVTSEERVQIASWKDSSVHTGGFADEAALKKWVVNCLGGGAVQKLTLDGRIFFVSTRRFTSGAPDTEVCFWSSSWKSEKLKPFSDYS